MAPAELPVLTLLLPRECSRDRPYSRLKLVPPDAAAGPIAARVQGTRQQADAVPRVVLADGVYPATDARARVRPRSPCRAPAPARTACRRRPAGALCPRPSEVSCQRPGQSTADRLSLTAGAANAGLSICSDRNTHRLRVVDTSLLQFNHSTVYQQHELHSI